MNYMESSPSSKLNDHIDNIIRYLGFFLFTAFALIALWFIFVVTSRISLKLTIFIFVLIGLIIAITMLWWNGLTKRFRLLSGELGLNYVYCGWGNYPGMEGTYRQREVKIGFPLLSNAGEEANLTSVVEAMGGSRTQRHPYTVIDVKHVGNINGKIDITFEGLKTKAAKLMGFREVTVGNNEFDKLFFIKASNETEAEVILSPDIQEKILQAKVPLKISRGSLNAKEYGIMSNQEIKKRLNILCDIAEQIETKMGENCV
jgi:hypothetical protein